MKVINYPGKWCLAIYHLIHINPNLFNRFWHVYFILIVIFLVFITLLKYDALGKTGALVRKHLNWLTSDYLFIICICLGTFVCRLPNFAMPELNPDESEWIANAATFHQGAIMWKTVSSYTSGPLVSLPLNIMLLFGDGLNYTTIRIFGMLFCILPALFLTWKTIRNLYGDLAARVTIVPLYIYFAGANSWDIVAYDSEHVPMVLTALAIYFLYRSVKNNTVSILSILVTGFILGSMPYAKLQSVPIGIGIGLLALIKIILLKNQLLKKRLIYCSILISGALLPSVITGIYLLKNNCWADFYADYIQLNLFYINAPIGNFHTTGLMKILLLPEIILQAFQSTIFVLTQLILIVIFVFVATGLNLGKLKAFFTSRPVLESGWIVLFAYMAVISPNKPFNHYQILFLAPFTFFAGTLIGRALNSGIQLSKTRSLSYIAAAFFILLGGAIFQEHNLTVGFAAAEKTYRVNPVSDIIKKFSHPNERMSIWGWGGDRFVETGLVQGNKYSHTYYEMILPQKNNRFIASYVEELNASKPTIFLDEVSPTAFAFTTDNYHHENYQALADYISKNYQFAGEADGKRVYVINSRMKEAKNGGN